MKKQHLQLSEVDRSTCLDLLAKGALKARVYKRVSALLSLDQGNTYQKTHKLVNLSLVSLGKLVKKYQANGLACLYDAPRSGRPVGITDAQRNKIMTLSCEEAPAGHSSWSLRLLADKVVELGYCEHISHSQVNKILKNMT